MARNKLIDPAYAHSRALPRPVGVWVAGVVAVVVVIATLVALTSRGGEQESATPPTDPGPTNAQNPAIPAPDPSKVHKPTDPDWLTAAPTGLVWRSVPNVVLQLPFSPADGPLKVDEAKGTATGYSHTPQGAVIAADQITRRLVMDSTNYTNVLAATTGLSATARANLEKVHANSDALRPQLGPDTPKHFTAFKVVSYLPNQATIQYAFPAPFAGSFSSNQVTVVWADNDWKVAAEPTDSKVINDLNGFTPVGG
ncbi:hypothetical protein [Antrihabitans stalactiti]|jgi:hypothetical protein|uniref:DUF8175 domain-containing protein n=1 Tax=Antrihabitans stalactiti TaxID=2584121 RepID=A0A848KM74_9NOCA|nr:hypothetical protein [Antrihabitans stalactiti]NMN99311.1 hypothetical protein [Antrihabitans stalactiti]